MEPRPGASTRRPEGRPQREGGRRGKKRGRDPKDGPRPPLVADPFLPPLPRPAGGQDFVRRGGERGNSWVLIDAGNPPPFLPAPLFSP
uniref:ICP0C n=1 Tax=Human herpesvirus 1 TaxID=10298 RepID=P87913_HHV1|nr:ICP0C [Human alphaherpesvirus 1]